MTCHDRYWKSQFKCTRQYYAHREKLRLIGREHDLEKLNLAALKIAREVADETGTLMAGNLSNSTIYKPDDPDIQKTIYEMFAVRRQLFFVFS